VLIVLRFNRLEGGEGRVEALAVGADGVADHKVLNCANDAVELMQLFFIVVGVISMALCFVILWLSFTSNVTENGWEFGVLRAVGLNSVEIVMVYVYEALSIVSASILCGTVIGLLIASSLTLQFNLFTEMPFKLSFPYALFFSMISMALVVAVAGSALPARKFLKRTISDVIRRQ
jgi:ABC-type antimicrobial peptide transport system permease subunit